MPANGRATLQVVFSRMADFVEVRISTEHRAAEPDGVFLNHVLRDVDLDLCWLLASGLLVESESFVHSTLDASLKSSVEAVEQGRAS